MPMRNVLFIQNCLPLSHPAFGYRVVMNQYSQSTFNLKLINKIQGNALNILCLQAVCQLIIGIKEFFPIYAVMTINQTNPQSFQTMFAISAFLVIFCNLSVIDQTFHSLTARVSKTLKLFVVQLFFLWLLRYL
jgi:hypothetical protein